MQFRLKQNILDIKILRATILIKYFLGGIWNMNSKGIKIALMAAFLASSLTLASCQKKEATNATNTTNTTNVTNATNATAPDNATSAQNATNTTASENATQSSSKEMNNEAAPTTTQSSASKSAKPKIEGC